MTVQFQVTFDCAKPFALGQRRSEVDDAVTRLEGVGAKKLFEKTEGDHYHVTMADPEGNEFCLR